MPCAASILVDFEYLFWVQHVLPQFHIAIEHDPFSSMIYLANSILMALMAGWWFGTFFIFPYIGKNHPNWLIFFRGVETTNQMPIYAEWTSQPLNIRSLYLSNRFRLGNKKPENTCHRPWKLVQTFGGYSVHNDCNVHFHGAWSATVSISGLHGKPSNCSREISQIR